MIRRKLATLALIILLVMPFIYSCDSGDTNALINWAKLWAMVHDITDTDGNMNYGAVARFGAGELFGLGSTGNDEGDAAIDIAKGTKDTLDKIRSAEQAADEGWKELDSGSNIPTKVLPHYNEAISLRPDDWSYRNGRGIAYLEDLETDNNDKLAQKDFGKANALAKKSGKPVEYLKMLKEREQAMATMVQHKKDMGALPTLYLYQEQSRLYGELYTLTSDNSYKLLKQQADTNLKEGYYWQKEPAK
jgi:hypothetical protein